MPVGIPERLDSVPNFHAQESSHWAKERVSRLPIATVMVGPGENQASSRASAILLLEQMGYPNVPVEISKCTLVER
jgi:hypothetical protein